MQTIFVMLMYKITPFLFKTVKGLVKGEKGETELLKKDWQKDVVYLVQFPRSPTIPNFSPFCIKIESFMRVNKIKYEIISTMSSRSKHNLLPFIELNGHQIADSQLILIKLKEYFKVQDYKNARDAATGRMIERAVEAHTFHAINYFKVYENPAAFVSLLSSLIENPIFNLVKPFLVPIVAKVFKGKVKQRISIGLGLFSREEMKDLLHRDLQSFEDLLGENKTFFGDKFTEADLTVFSHFAVTTYIPLECYTKQILKEGKKFPRVSAFLQNVRDEVWGKEFEKN
ncbi:unnamed protein product, partial [Mesorhabditis belari]|uniref:Glutathione S-transferase n=1 Tax=Mesorhabditis belari TaxID=2138241 RepID=A0AAF3F0T6_9BILA